VPGARVAGQRREGRGPVGTLPEFLRVPPPSLPLPSCRVSKHGKGRKGHPPPLESLGL